MIRAFVLALVLAVPASAAAQVSVPLEYAGRAGVWVELEYSRVLAGLVEAEPHQVEQLRLLEERLQLRDLEANTLRAALSTSQAETAATRLRVEELERSVADLSAWWRDPWLWGALGLVLGAAIPVAVIVAVSS